MTAGPPDWSYAAALASLDRMTPTRLRVLLESGGPELAWAWASGRELPPAGSLVARIFTGDQEGTLRARWSGAARGAGPEAVAERCAAAGIRVTYLGQADHPVAAATDPLPAPVLFSRGDLGLLRRGRRAGVVGTRNATASGRATARQLGVGLAAAGVHVVSGLARGVDGQAHRGALGAGGDGRPIAVVGSGCDRPYPPEHRTLWHEVAETGLLLSEAGPGAPPAPHRFPLRNRLIAGLSEVVVVVESRERGGSLITAALAADRGVPVMAVPGGVHLPAARGTNALLRDGAAPVLDVDDVLLALDIDHTRTDPARLPDDDREPPAEVDRAVLGVLGERAMTSDEVAAQLGAGLPAVAAALHRLTRARWVAELDGWYEAVRGLPGRSSASPGASEYSPGR